MKKHFLIIIFSLACLNSCFLLPEPLRQFLRVIYDERKERKTAMDLLTQTNNEEAIINTPSESGTIGSIDIPSPGYFLLLRPWKKGTLATMTGKNGRARFAEISFKSKSGMTITQLLNFPEQFIDKMLITAPEAGICISGISKAFFIADIINKKTKDYRPLHQWRFHETNPIILDPENGIICFKYYATGGYKEQHSYNIIYDVKNDEVLYESPKDGEENSFIYPFSTELILCGKYFLDEIQDTWFTKWTREKYFLYNWKTKEIFP